MLRVNETKNVMKTLCYEGFLNSLKE